MDEIKVLTSMEEVKALSDPYRFKILDCLYDIGKAATVKQIADKLGEVPAKVHYHIKKLESNNIVVLDHIEEVKGILAKYYLPTAKNFEIKCSESYGDFAANLMLGETQRMLGKIYDDSKDIFLSQLQKDVASKEKNKFRGTITTNDIYLTHDEALELEKYIASFFDKHKSAKDDNKKKRHHCFFSIIRME